jgi:hypothetical protein
MPEPGLPLDHDRYHQYLMRLRELVECGDDLPDPETLRDFFVEHRNSFGPRTEEMLFRAPPQQLRTMIHVMVLGASELADLHEASRKWLVDHGEALPPWDVTVPRTAQRLVTFAGRVLGVVEFEPEKRVELNPNLTPAERRWATALAVGIGERPQWTNEEVTRFAAYLAMGAEEFADERQHSDEQLSHKHQVPVDAVRLRRQLPDELPPG